MHSVSWGWWHYPASIFMKWYCTASRGVLYYRAVRSTIMKLGAGTPCAFSNTEQLLLRTFLNKLALDWSMGSLRSWDAFKILIISKHSWNVFWCPRCFTLSTSSWHAVGIISLTFLRVWQSWLLWMREWMITYVCVFDCIWECFVLTVYENV